MNRIAIIMNGPDFCGYASDEPVEFYVVDPNVPHDRVYLYQSGKHGPQHVHALIGGYAVGHKDDAVLGGDQSHLPPSKPHIKAVKP